MRIVAVLLLLAAGCGGADGERAARQIVDDLAASRYAQAGSRYRQQESLVLSAQAAPVWREALLHEDTQVRQLAIDALSRIAAPGDFELLEALLQDPVRGVRHQARDGLVRIDAGRSRTMLRGMLGSPRPEDVVLAAEGLANLQDGGAVGPMSSRLLDSGLPEPARASLCLPLARLGEREAIAALVAVAADATIGVALRRAAAEAAAALATTDDVEAMSALAASDDDFVREMGQTALELAPAASER